MLLTAGTKYVLDGVEHQIPAGEQYRGPTPQLLPTQAKFLTRLKGIMRHFHTVAEEHGIQYYLCCGSLLGAIKFKGIIPWDDDIDVSVTADQIPKIEQAFATGPYKLIKFRFGYKLCVRNFPYYPFVDIMIVDIDPRFSDDRYTFSYPLRRGKPSFGLRKSFPRKIHPASMIFPLRLYQFEDFQVWGPRDGEAFCRQSYGEDCFNTSFIKTFNTHVLSAVLRL
jgi:hypothetical protein